jgi:uncharacterized protein (DUF433 family)
MSLQIQAEPTPLKLDPHGTVRVAGTRVSLESIIWLYQQGHSAESLHRSFPSVSLSDVHFVIGYHLRHKQAVDAYLEQRRSEAEELRRQIETQSGYGEHRGRVVARLEAEARKRGLRE